MIRRIFITGATGFIGKYLALRLAKENKIFALVRPQSIGKAALLKEAETEIIEGDLLDKYTYSKKLNSVDYIFHLAALFKLGATRDELYKYNIVGTQRLLESCLGKNIRKIVHFSTAYVAGTKEANFIKEIEPYPKKFKNWYEWSKAESEKLALDFYKKYNLPVVIVRPSIVYGPGSTYGFYNALNIIAKGKLMAYPGDGKNKVHLIHIEDLINAVIHIAQLENRMSEIYHICDDFPHTCAELINFACQQLGVRPPAIILPRFLVKLGIKSPYINRLIFNGNSTRLLDYFLYNQTFSNTKLKSTGFLFTYPNPLIGLQSTINWFKENKILSSKDYNVSI